MKKLAVILAVISIAALAAPAFSATNPFMDVPLNHWAYDAIGQLAAHGILSGFPDGTYKGQQQTTRYEMASALARSLAVVDMTKASKQDVEMLKRLVVEFKDELEALGVRVDELDERVAVLENRLGGWHIHGTLVLDLKNESGKNALDRGGDGYIGFDEARLLIDRTWGENDEYFFRARLRNDGSTDDGWTNEGTHSLYFDRYYVEMPFFFDSKMTVGRFLWDVESANYQISLPQTGGWTGDPVITNRAMIGWGLEKNFGLGVVRGYVSHRNQGFAALNSNTYTYNGEERTINSSNINARSWEIFLNGSFQFTEQIGFDLGGQVMIGDNAETVRDVHGHDDISFKNLWTIFAGLHFNFNDNIGLKGAFYHQKIDSEVVDPTGRSWVDYGYGLADGDSFIDDANHWRVIIDVKQEALKFTSLWLEYGQYKRGFWAPQGDSTIWYSGSSILVGDNANGGDQVTEGDLKYWRVGLGQEWNEKWATHLFYYGYNYNDANKSDRNDDGTYGDAKISEFGVGVQYTLNDYTKMGLNYVHVDNDDMNNNGSDKDNIIRFRTAISF